MSIIDRNIFFKITFYLCREELEEILPDRDTKNTVDYYYFCYLKHT